MTKTSGEAARPADRSSLFFGLLRNQRLEGLEKSFKMAGNSLLSNRYLLGIPRGGIRPESLFELCEKLTMPERYLAAFKEHLPGADTIHFGFEENETGFICKVYLEYARRLYHVLEGAARGPAPGAAQAELLHLAYKWDALDRDKCTIAKYHCYPRLPVEAMLKRMTDIYSCNSGRSSFDIVKGIVALAASRTVKSLMYLEVSEENNPRASFDINLHAAGLRLHEIEQFLSQLQMHYSIPLERFGRLLEQVRREKLGHVSGGISREGRDFVTVYHEVGGR